ncbi:MAG: VCBS repeat-containing protein [Myxococcales bacterium]|nr:VCBS repeat-containing protein [Myxococcales bacterium]
MLSDGNSEMWPMVSRRDRSIGAHLRGGLHHPLQHAVGRAPRSRAKMAQLKIPATCCNCLGAKVVYTSPLGKHKRSDFRPAELLQVMAAKLVDEAQCPICKGTGTIDVLVRDGRGRTMGRRIRSRFWLDAQRSRAAAYWFSPQDSQPLKSSYPAGQATGQWKYLPGEEMQASRLAEMAAPAGPVQSPQSWQYLASEETQETRLAAMTGHSAALTADGSARSASGSSMGQAVSTQTGCGYVRNACHPKHRTALRPVLFASLLGWAPAACDAPAVAEYDSDAPRDASMDTHPSMPDLGSPSVVDGGGDLGAAVVDLAAGDGNRDFYSAGDQSTPLDMAHDQSVPLDLNNDQSAPLDAKSDQTVPVDAKNDLSVPLDLKAIDQTAPADLAGDLMMVAPCLGFLPPTRYLGGHMFGPVALADFNNAGKLDCVAHGYSGKSILLFLGQGNGALTLAGGSPRWQDIRRLAVADLNLDGWVDVATSYENSLGLSVLLGKGNGAFSPEIWLPLPGTSPRMSGLETSTAMAYPTWFRLTNTPRQDSTRWLFCLGRARGNSKTPGISEVWRTRLGSRSPISTMTVCSTLFFPTLFWGTFSSVKGKVMVTSSSSERSTLMCPRASS